SISTASIEPTVIVAGNLQFTKDILSITQEQVLNELGLGFASALTVCMERKIVNSYTISNFIGVAYREAMALGTSAKVYEPGIVDRLIASAVGEAKALDAKAK
ncbi:MAG: hypothetical protein M1504_03350, partial [Candidatus Marsarchaeota archaeon]|nr:hypothetical protein [Candidatus Marsarchaeota archaeon]